MVEKENDPPEPPVLRSVPQEKLPPLHSSLPVLGSQAERPEPHKVPLTVSAVVEAYANCEVEEACSPDWNHRAVEVALAREPKLVVGVYGHAKVA